MSSPIALNKKTFIKKAIISFHKKASHYNRINLLAELFVSVIKKLFNDKTKIQLLDIGCGDMLLSEKIIQLDSRLNPICLDIYPLPQNLKDENKWEKYIQFDGKNLPFSENSFDVAILSDVLHHDFKNSFNLLNEAARVCQFIIIKDHFEYGIYSRIMLKIMDFVGNWGYGVSIPDRYFTKNSYVNLFKNAGLTEVIRIEDIELYSHSYLLSILLKPKWQFISALKKI